MRGYTSFILVSLLVSVLIVSANSYSIILNKNKSDFLGAEALYQDSMNLKQVAEEAIFSGAQKGLEYYIYTLPVNEIPNPLEAKKFAEIGAYTELANLDLDSASLWCGFTEKSESAQLKKEMIQQQKTLICSDCKLILDLSCMDFISVEISPEFQLEKITLEKDEIYRKGRVGISVYSKKFNVSSITNLRVDPYG